MAEFVDFDIKKGRGSALEGEGLKNLMAETLGPVKQDGDVLSTSFGATTLFQAKLVSKSVLAVKSESDKTASMESMLESQKRYNDFMEKATGFNSKERGKRLQKKAKDGKL